MPYADRQKQLDFMRDYMKYKRAEKRLERLKQDREAFKARFEANPDLKLLYHNFDPTTIYDREIAELEGLLINCAKVCKTVPNCEKLREMRQNETLKDTVNQNDQNDQEHGKIVQMSPNVTYTPNTVNPATNEINVELRRSENQKNPESSSNQPYPPSNKPDPDKLLFIGLRKMSKNE